MLAIHRFCEGSHCAVIIGFIRTMPLKPFAPNRGAEKKIFLLKPRGFCAGVVRAIDVVKIALDLYGPPVYVRKEIVHNKHVVDELRAAGAVFVDELAEVPEGARAIDRKSTRLNSSHDQI